MPVIVDAMGGDHSPSQVVAGCLKAANTFDFEIVLVGQEEALAPFEISHPKIRIHPASQVIEMGEHPAQAFKRKPDSSIRVGIQLAQSEPGSAFVSAGSTGAVMTAALLTWKRLPGVERPCIAGFVPTADGGNTVIADIGANVDCKPSNLAQFAVLCSAYANFTVGVETPRVGLLNIGSEPSKGNEAALAAFEALSQVPGIQFIGNVEPQAVFSGDADVVVTDGFAGNIFLKTSESISNLFQSVLKSGLQEDPELLKRGASWLSQLGRYDTNRQEHAGAPLLGTNGTAIIVHGDAQADTICNAVGVAGRAAASGYLEHLRATFSKKET